MLPSGCAQPTSGAKARLGLRLCGTTEVVPFPCLLTRFLVPPSQRGAIPRDRDYKRPAILLAIFLAASALTPDSRRSMFTITSPLRIMRAEFPGAR